MAVTDDPEAVITIEPLCPPERLGHAVASISFDPRRSGRPYRYLYCGCIVTPRPCNTVNGVCRVDVTDGTVVHFHGKDSVVWEEVGMRGGPMEEKRGAPG